jgi:hypothetical protein
MTDTLSLGFVSNTGRPARVQPAPQQRRKVFKPPETTQEISTAKKDDKLRELTRETRRMKKPKVSQLVSTSTAPHPPPKESNLFGQKTEFLEQTSRKHQSNIDCINAQIIDVTEQITKYKNNSEIDILSLFHISNIIYGKTLKDTPFFIADEDDDLENCFENRLLEEHIPTSKWIQLVYPMKKHDSNIYMKAKMVNNDSGQLYWAWVLLKDGDNKYIGQFSTYPDT